MTYSQKIDVLNGAQDKLAALHSHRITEGDVYREALAYTISSISQKISACGIPILNRLTIIGFAFLSFLPKFFSNWERKTEI